VWSAQPKCNASTNSVKRNCNFRAPRWNCMTHREALQYSLDMSRDSHLKNDKLIFFKMRWKCTQSVRGLILLNSPNVLTEGLSGFLFLGFSFTLLPYCGTFCKYCPSNYPTNKSLVGVRSGKRSGHEPQLSILSSNILSKAARELSVVGTVAESCWNHAARTICQY
jgi:hypothetical protein